MTDMNKTVLEVTDLDSESVVDDASEVVNNASEAVNDAYEVVSDVVNEASEAVSDVVNEASEAVKVLVEAVEEPLPKKPVTFLMDIESKAIVESLENLENFELSKLMSVLPSLMKHVENYKNLNGVQKRQLVINMVKHIIDITDGPGNDEVWDPILKKLVPGIIDTLIQVNDGKLKLRNKKKTFSLLKLFCCGGKPETQ